MVQVAFAKWKYCNYIVDLFVEKIDYAAPIRSALETMAETGWDFELTEKLYHTAVGRRFPQIFTNVLTNATLKLPHPKTIATLKALDIDVTAYLKNLDQISERIEAIKAAVH
jgi:hypothetical protein